MLLQGPERGYRAGPRLVVHQHPGTAWFQAPGSCEGCLTLLALEQVRWISCPKERPNVSSED